MVAALERRHVRPRAGLALPQLLHGRSAAAAPARFSGDEAIVPTGDGDGMTRRCEGLRVGATQRQKLEDTTTTISSRTHDAATAPAAAAVTFNNDDDFFSDDAAAAAPTATHDAAATDAAASRGGRWRRHETEMSPSNRN